MSNSAPGPLIGSGRNADVYDVGGGRVLRRYRDGRPHRAVAAEAGVMRHARAHGLPVPEVFEFRDSEIVMERAAGPTLLDMVSRRPWTVRAAARLVARLHAQVHAVPALDWLPWVFDARPAHAGRAHADATGGGVGGGVGGGSGAGDGTGEAGRGEAGAGVPDQVLVHRDLHPLNVIMTADGPRIIDWEGAARGPASADVALTWVIVGFSEAPGPRLRMLATRPLQALFTREFLRAAGPADRGVFEAAVRNRMADGNTLPSEMVRLERLLRSGRIPGR